MVSLSPPPSGKACGPHKSASLLFLDSLYTVLWCHPPKDEAGKLADARYSNAAHSGRHDSLASSLEGLH